MTLAIFHVLKGQRNVEELLRAIPDARLIPGDVCSGGSRRVAPTLLGLLVIVIAGLSAGCRDSSTASGAPLPPVVKVERVLEKDVPIYGEWVGTTVGYVTAQISARVSGYLVSQTYKEGARVKAAAFGAELVVMGAYGHSYLNEWIFGGVTRTVLREAELPVLMSGEDREPRIGAEPSAIAVIGPYWKSRA